MRTDLALFRTVYREADARSRISVLQNQVRALELELEHGRPARPRLIQTRAAATSLVMMSLLALVGLLVLITSDPSLLLAVPLVGLVAWYDFGPEFGTVPKNKDPISEQVNPPFPVVTETSHRSLTQWVRELDLERRVDDSAGTLELTLVHDRPLPTKTVVRFSVVSSGREGLELISGRGLVICSTKLEGLFYLALTGVEIDRPYVCSFTGALQHFGERHLGALTPPAA